MAREVLDLPEPPRPELADVDAMNKLASWFKALPDEQRRAVVVFAEVDTRLQLHEGAAKRLLTRAIADNFQVKRMGEDTVVFRPKPIMLTGGRLKMDGGGF